MCRLALESDHDGEVVSHAEAGKDSVDSPEAICQTEEHATSINELQRRVDALDAQLSLSDSAREAGSTSCLKDDVESHNKIIQALEKTLLII